jgi:hypothetical protein
MAPQAFLASAQETNPPSWDDAKTKTSARQKILDGIRAGARFFALTHTDVDKKTPGKLVQGSRQLKCYDGGAHEALERTLLEHARLYGEAKNVKPAEALKRILAPVFDMTQGDEAEVQLDLALWGKAQPIGIVPDKFWISPVYATDADRWSRITDFLGQKSVDVSNNIRANVLWPLGTSKEGLATLISENGPGSTKLLYAGLLAAHHYMQQGIAILRGSRKVSVKYESAVVTRWNDSQEFRELVRVHQERAKNAGVASKGDETRRKHEESIMGEEWGFKCLPVNGRFVAYDPELVKGYDVSKK